jgi:hypothetical protein
MKKLLIACLSVMASVAAFGQGQVNFLNNAQTPIRTNNQAGAVGNMVGANQWRIGLYTAPQGTVNESLFTLVAVATNSSLVGGRIGSGGGLVDLAGNTGTPIAYQVKAWSLSSGASYEAAVASGAGYGGKSPIGGVTPAVGGAPVPSLFSSTAGTPEFVGQLSAGFDMVPLVPEPSTIALGLLGLGAIVLFRRRK